MMKSMKQKPKCYSSDEKVAILRRHLLEPVHNLSEIPFTISIFWKFSCYLAD
jgi:hypothetical protein